MSGFQQSALLNFFNESNTALVQALADKYGFDMAEAMSHIKGLDSSSVLTKTKKTKKTKDPNAPKRPPTAFFLFCKQFRMDHADEITGMRAPDVAKMAGAAWNDAKTSGAAEPFHTEAAELKAAAVNAQSEQSKLIVSAEAGNEPPLGNALNGLVAEALLNEEVDDAMNTETIAAIQSTQKKTQKKAQKAQKKAPAPDNDSGNE